MGDFYPVGRTFSSCVETEDQNELSVCAVESHIENVLSYRVEEMEMFCAEAGSIGGNDDTSGISYTTSPFLEQQSDNIKCHKAQLLSSCCVCRSSLSFLRCVLFTLFQQASSSGPRHVAAS